jgi:hypothetical protein
MRSWFFLALALAILTAPLVRGAPHEFVVNGEFEADLAPAWVERNNCSEISLDRLADLDEDDDLELHAVCANGKGNFILGQRILVPDLALGISARLKAIASASGGAWSSIGLSLRYLSRNQELLGETFIGRISRECPWVSTETFHLMEIAEDFWETMDLDLAEELLSLPGVDPERIWFLEVGVRIEADNC